ncbi:MAG: hypothetical protein LUE11_12360, partial [Clostridia bacterium]|nr:hypothetical protein [Clostridia bacterium]
NFPNYSEDGGYVMAGLQFVEVEETSNQIPAVIQLLDGETVVQEITVDQTEWEEKQGHVTMFNVEIPKKYDGQWNAETFTAKAYDAAGNALETNVNQRSNKIILINFPNYSEDGGYVMAGLQFE